MDEIKSSSSEPKQRKWRVRLTLLAIVLLFTIPLIGAWWLYTNTEPGQPWATSNKGDLITPARPLSGFTLRRGQNDGIYTLEDLRGKWTLVFVPPPDCDETCKKNIYYMRQVWAGLGHEAHRVQRLLVLRAPAQLDALAGFLENYPDMSVVFDSGNALIGQIPRGEASLGKNVYLIDPLGNLMMAFPQTLDPRDMLKDLKKLLKISTIG
jgi:cytochrome oxidase Cu insertion factor (SCO1/SenC/PrrC family)